MRPFLSFFLIIGFAQQIVAAEIYVNNRIGSDAFDGSAPQVATLISGPVRTIRRALELMQRGDSLVFGDSGDPYYDSLNLVGGRFSGSPALPLFIQGNGATLCGIRRVPPEAWQPVSRGLWQVQFSRKGSTRLFREGATVPEHRLQAGDKLAEALPLDAWGKQAGVVTIRISPEIAPGEEEWSYAAADYGISLVNVHDVVIRDLKVLGFRVDGVNVDGNSKSVLLDGLTITECGRAGVAIGGSSRLDLNQCVIRDHGRHSMIITEQAGARVDETDFGDVEPLVVKTAPLD